MALSRALRNLLKIREMQEEQQKNALESAAAELRMIETALADAHTRQAAAHFGAFAGECVDPLDRRALQLQAETETRRRELLHARRQDSQQVVESERALYLERRTERRQAEAVVDAELLRDHKESERKLQREVDDWYGTRAATRSSDRWGT